VKATRIVGLWAALALAALLLVGAPLVGARWVRSGLLGRVGARLGRAVTAGGVRLGWGWLELRDLTVDGGDAGAAPPLVVPVLRARFSVAALLAGRAEVSELELDHPRVEVVRGGADDNVTSLVEALRGPRASGGGGARARLHVEKIRLRGAAVIAADEQLGQLEVAQLDADLHPDGPGLLRVGGVRLQLAAGPRLSADDLTVSLALKRGRLDGLPSVEVHGGSAAPFRGLALTGIRGTVQPDVTDPKRAVVAVQGSYGGSDAPLWTASGWLSPETREGELKLRAARFKLSQLDSVLAAPDATESARILNAHDAEVDAHLNLTFAGSQLAFAGAFHLSGLTVAHPMLGPLPVARFGFDARAAGRLDVDERRLILSEAVFDYRNVHATITADIEHLGPRPRFAATLKVRPLQCQTALAALPVELTPTLQGFKLQGTFSTDLHLGIDLDDLDAGVDLGGLVGIEGCKVLEAPEWASAERLGATFEQTVETEPGRWLTFFAGPENPDWAPYADISPYLVNSIISSEDFGFFKHHGFIPSEFRSALRQNLQRGYFRLGASSITMQMVKNVLLSREKTLSRKLQELFLTWYIEHSLTKERILEIYFNVIEFGPGIYGIGRAARHYFGKTAKELAPREAAWFSSILPNPKRRYVQFCRANGLVDAKWDAYVKRILRRLHERQRITDEEYAEAIAAPLQFDRTEAMDEKECLAMVKRITTPPGAPPAPTTAVR
jgi:hypothetical protein